MNRNRYEKAKVESSEWPQKSAHRAFIDDAFIEGTEGATWVVKMERWKWWWVEEGTQGDDTLLSENL